MQWHEHLFIMLTDDQYTNDRMEKVHTISSTARVFDEIINDSVISLVFLSPSEDWWRYMLVKRFHTLSREAINADVC